MQCLAGESRGMGEAQKNAVFKMKTAVVVIRYSLKLTAAARRTAGTRLHSGEHKTLSFMEIDVCVHEHAFGALFQINLQSV
jgi:hypothetical protein